MGIDVYDYTLLHKKGFLKLPEIEKGEVVFNKEGDIDFTKMNMPLDNNDDHPRPISIPQPSMPSPTDSPFSLLDSFSQNAQSMPTPPSIQSPVPDLSLSVNNNMDMLNIKNKLDALDYSINRLLDKIQGIEEKLSRNP